MCKPMGSRIAAVMLEPIRAQSSRLWTALRTVGCRGPDTDRPFVRIRGDRARRERPRKHACFVWRSLDFADALHTDPGLRRFAGKDRGEVRCQTPAKMDGRSCDGEAYLLNPIDGRVSTEIVVERPDRISEANWPWPYQHPIVQQ